MAKDRLISPKFRWNFAETKLMFRRLAETIMPKRNRPIFSFCRNFREFLKGISLYRFGHGARTFRMDLGHRHSARTCSMGQAGLDFKDRQHWHGEAARTSSMEMQHVHAACTCCTDMLHGEATRCSLYMHLGHAAMQQWLAAWTCTMDMQHEHSERTCSMDMQCGHAAGLCSMGMQRGHAADKV
jgi:hypothetical protein